MPLWVKLTSVQIISENGKPKRYYPGDWVEVGKQTAYRWITEGLAEKPGVNVLAELVDYTAGIMVIGSIDTNTETQIKETIPHLEFAYGDVPKLLFSENLIYNSKLKKLRVELLPIGFKWLSQFQVCLPLFDYKTLAIHLGNSDDQIKIKSVIKELRVPVYSTDLIFVRRCDDTFKLIEKWQEYKKEVSDDRLSFLCALYEVKPLHLALPNTWLG